MSASFKDDASLVKRFQSGDSEAFDEIDRRYRARIVSFLLQRLHSEELAEEITQETLVRALIALPDLSDGSFLPQWLYRIAYNRLVDYSRRNKLPLWKAVSYDVDTNGQGEGDAAETCFFNGKEKRLNGVSFENRTPEEQVIRAEENKNIWRVAKEILSHEEFQMLWMKYVDESSDEQVASKFNRRIGTVRVILSRVRKKLAKHLRIID